MQKYRSANIHEHPRKSKTKQRLCERTSTNMQKDRNADIYTDLRKSSNICETQNKTANVYEILRANINERAERQKYGNAELEICENLRTSANIENNTANMSQRNMQKDRNDNPLTSSLRHRPHNTSHLPTSSNQSLVSAIESLADFGRSNNISLGGHSGSII